MRKYIRISDDEVARSNIFVGPTFDLPICYVYAYLDSKGRYKYIGKGSGNRSHQHIDQCRNKKNKDYESAFYQWLRRARKYEVVLLKQELTCKEAFKLESETISRIGLDKLLNNTQRHCGGKIYPGTDPVIMVPCSFGRPLWFQDARTAEYLGYGQAKQIQKVIDNRKTHRCAVWMNACNPRMISHVTEPFNIKAVRCAETICWRYRQRVRQKVLNILLTGNTKGDLTALETQCRV